jgi:predicted AAA+ superfamily ATPase
LLIIATGSSSFELGARTRESLAGRARRTQLLPFSLQEVAAVVPAGLAPAIRDLRLRELWEKLVVTGGYPEP